MKEQLDYCAMPRTVSQHVLRQLDTAWFSFFKALKSYKINPHLFTGRPKIPKYKDKVNGRNMLVFTDQAISTPLLKEGVVKVSGLDISVKTKQKPESIRQVRIVPQTGCYVVEVVYEREEQVFDFDLGSVAGIDIGLDNLVALTTNQPGLKPILVNGKPLKSINQFYNKRVADLKSRLSGNKRTSNQINALSLKRNKQINNYLHNASRSIVNYLVDNRIGTLVVGKNDGWKQDGCR